MDESLVGEILAVVRDRTGIDFSRYREGTVRRRIQNRMIALGMEDPKAYFSLLNKQEDETIRLVERISIKVSRFYRNRETFELIRREVLPQLAESRQGVPLRVWSAGCGFGEEPYTLAMLLDEARLPGTVDATDIDITALDKARKGLFPADAFEELPASLSERCVERSTGSQRQIDECIRLRVRFFRHDLTSRTPPAEQPYDLVLCRNVLIYLGRQAQHHAFDSLRAAAAKDGFICLGEAEWPPLLAHTSLEPVDRRCRIFRVTTTTDAPQ